MNQPKNSSPKKNPKTSYKPRTQDRLHGVTLEAVINHLVKRFGWEELGKRITIKCFTNEPSVASSLKFLRRTEWARKEVEKLYLHSLTPYGQGKNADKNKPKKKP